MIASLTGTVEYVGLDRLIVAVGGADALGIPRLVKTLPELRETGVAGRVLVVVNKVRRGSMGGRPLAALAEVWERYSPGEPLAASLGWDPEACDEALLSGAVLAEAAPNAELRRAIGELARQALRANGAGEPPGEPGVPPGTRLGRRVGAWLCR